MSKQSSITVTVRVRPFNTQESAHLVAAPDSLQLHSSTSITSSVAASYKPHLQHAKPLRGIRRVVKVLDQRILVFDPPSDSALGRRGNRRRSMTNLPASRIHRVSKGDGRDLRYAFDRVFDETASQYDVYTETARPLLDSVLDGFNATVFAYGATGCGKTHTISGTPEHPGVIYLTLKELFERIEQLKDERIFSLRLSYLEIYNESIRDLLATTAQGRSRNLSLREDADRRITVPGLTSLSPSSLEEVMKIILRGNANRTMSPTEANATSSRSHAVLQVSLTQKPRTADINEDHTLATLSIIDLAGSERANATRNRGERLKEGANINRSLLALGNCINALCDPHRRAHVPYRDSKLTRLLKFSLGGNCKTVMIVCVSPSSVHYEETYNTLKYANRAKNIKTEVLRNMISVDRHVSQYVKAIYELRQQIRELERRLEQSDLPTRNTPNSTSISFDAKLIEARDLLRAAFEQTLPRQKSVIEDVRHAKRMDDCIHLVRYWLTSCERTCADTTDERAQLARAKLDTLLTERSVFVSKVNPKEIYGTFEQSISPIIRTLRDNDADVYADVLQDEVDLLKSIHENQILDAQNSTTHFTHTLETLLTASFRLLPSLQKGGFGDAHIFLKNWLINLAVKNEPFEYNGPSLSSLSEISVLNQQLRQSCLQDNDPLAALPFLSSPSHPRPRPPAMFVVKSPKKPILLPKRSHKKRVRFEDTNSPTEPAVDMEEEFEDWKEEDDEALKSEDEEHLPPQKPDFLQPAQPSNTLSFRAPSQPFIRITSPAAPIKQASQDARTTDPPSHSDKSSDDQQNASFMSLDRSMTEMEVDTSSHSIRSVSLGSTPSRIPTPDLLSSGRHAALADSKRTLNFNFAATSASSLDKPSVMIPPSSNLSDASSLPSLSSRMSLPLPSAPNKTVRRLSSLTSLRLSNPARVIRRDTGLFTGPTNAPSDAPSHETS
ncbi:kinesin-like protein Klp5 [Schizosaccharomyces japonicus yFS275]|uniref:Kinesin-like protein n=1 Tax=Schizosaccharomyces japonicus (strain yFS275 / FY16936) TaxID=402676 RepID=B6K0A4_SCHJY|nr:kinesin-like protein Klp5 [Schizosaccharomyces japonicus yFS275]EEB06254.1 kinesin-like protein Klp5 [Schizosaccharomyces japonicus yFS275]